MKIYKVRNGYFYGISAPIYRNRVLITTSKGYFALANIPPVLPQDGE